MRSRSTVLGPDSNPSFSSDPITGDCRNALGRKGGHLGWTYTFFGNIHPRDDIGQIQRTELLRTAQGLPPDCGPLRLEPAGSGGSRSRGLYLIAVSRSVACMRSGLFLPLFDELADPALVARLAGEAEEAGWHGVFVWDHVRWREPVVEVADPWITLAAIATATTGVRLGPMVTPLARRRPVKVARETATLDRLSGCLLYTSPSPRDRS